MSQKPQLCIGMALAMSWLSRNGWRRAESEVEKLLSIDAYIQLTQKAEAAKLDFVFRPDTLFLKKEFLASEPGFTSFDPMVLLAAIAPHTQRIGLVATASTTFNPPYVVARQLQSLHWVTQGRAGWNIVTALEGQQNFGEEQMMPSYERYQKAAEFLQTVLKLWQSYPYSALRMDKASGQFADTRAIVTINHNETYFAVQGPLNVPSHPSGQMPLFQAGSSDHGRAFAAQVADAIFAATPDLEAGVELKQDLARRALQSGRNPDAIKVLPGLSLYLAESREQAEALFRQTQQSDNFTKSFNYLHEALGVDFSKWPMEKPITLQHLPKQQRQVRSQTHSDLLRRLIERESPSLQELLTRPEVIGSSHWLVVGTVQDAYESIVQRVQAGAADGFIAVPGGSLSSLNLFFDQLMPMLSANGWFRSEYQGTTLREHLNLPEEPSQLAHANTELMAF
ncbi:NtaA/DmoA family FMN-dependent monooxygenase [Vibrio cidicii]|uniref:NtaA/DmoA family FMN-dependent monooxygenase n=1 Tax=Vibrio cidicii TaxID=1763883 RepID=UPI0018C31085|nr:NtaA/DmoA family FMN-dependent monooxygenase [Vibrio cidicii]MBG0757047.1 monooxygenase [Vibrio cidicii]